MTTMIVNVTKTSPIQSGFLVETKQLEVPVALRTRRRAQMRADAASLTKLRTWRQYLASWWECFGNH